MTDPRAGSPPAEKVTEEPYLDDWQLVELAISNPQAFEPLFTRYWDAVYRYCFYRLGNVEDAEDAAIHVLTKAFGSLDRLSNTGKPFRSWLFVVAHNEVVNYYRARTRNPQVAIADGADGVDTGLTPEELVMAMTEAQATCQLVSQLSERLRQVVELRLAGLTDSEIAQALDISIGAVRQAQFRAIRQLRILMNVPEPRGRLSNG